MEENGVITPLRLDIVSMTIILTIVRGLKRMGFVEGNIMVHMKDP
jgi:hypothetical protein